MRRTTASATAVFTTVLFTTVALFTGLLPAHAQTAAAIISGTITDDSGGVLPGVSVTVSSPETGASRTTVTDEGGRYSAPNLAVGTYNIRAELSGFQAGVREGVRLTVGRHAVVDFRLGLGDLSEEVTVIGEASLVDTTSSSIGEASLVDTTSSSIGGMVEQKEIAELPLNGRSFGELTKLIPGVVRGGGVSGFQDGYTDSISIRGGRGESNKILLDGTDVQGIDNRLPGSVAGVTLGVDAIREFKVEVGTYSAEFGRSIGGVINVSTKAGTNQFHGTAFEFHRNDSLDTRNFFDEVKPDFNRNQFGFSLGGPILRDRTHFFVNGEILRDRLQYTQIAMVPNELARQGFLPKASGGLTNVGVAPGVAPYLALYPLPNGPDLGDGTAQLVQLASQPTDQQFVAARLDHRFSAGRSMFARYTYDNGKRINPSTFTYLTQPERTRNQFVTIEEQRVVTPKFFNTLRVGYSRNFKTLAAAESELDVPADLGFTAGHRVFDGELLVEGLGDLGIADAPRLWATNKYQVSNQVVWALGRQTLKGGFEIIRVHQNISQNSNNGGEYQFTSLRNFLRGSSRRFRARLPGADQTRSVRNTYFAWYVQDDVQLGSRLTANIGLRHEVHTGPTEKHGRCGNVDDIFEAPRVGCPLFPTFAKNFGPRLGLAWDATGDGKTSVRGGFGIFYSELSASSYYTSMTNQPPFTAVADVRNAPFPNAFETILKSGRSRLRANPNSFTAVPSTMQMSLSVQRELLAGTVATIGYAGALGRNWITRGQENVAEWVILPDGRKFFPAGQRPRSPLYNEVRRVTTSVDTSYHGLLTELRRRFSSNFSLQASYTLSKAIDTLPFTTRGDVMDFYDVERDLGLSDNHVRHNFTLGAVGEVPRFSGGLTNAVLGGWQAAAIVSLSAGRPFSANLGFNRSRDRRGNTSSERPNLVAGASNNPVLGGHEQYFDPFAFELQEPGFYGNLGRNTLIGPGFASVDLSLSKNVGLGGARRLQFRLELFNALDRLNLGQPQSRIFTSSGRSGAAGRITRTSSTARQIQLGAKLLF